MHYERYERNKTLCIFYLPFTLLQQSVFGLIHALWENLWTLKKYRDTDVDYKRYDRRRYCSLTVHWQQYRENIKSTTDAYKRMYTHK